MRHADTQMDPLNHFHLSSSSRFDIVRHFTAAIDVESSEFLYRTTGTQAAVMALFSVASLSMRLVYNHIPRPIGITIATLSYVSFSGVWSTGPDLIRLVFKLVFKIRLNWVSLIVLFGHVQLY